MSRIMLNDETICTFERTLTALGYVRVKHSYRDFVLFDVWEREGLPVIHVDGMPSGRYLASFRRLKK